MNGAGTTRLFTALWPAPAARDAAARWQATADWPTGTALVAPERLHVTLHFIGPVPNERLPAIADALSRVRCDAFSLRFGRAAAWGRGLVVGLPEATPPALAALHAAQAEVLHGLGLHVEHRPFRPHLTLARDAAGATLPDAAFDWPAPAWRLVASQNGYRALAMVPLA